MYSDDCCLCGDNATGQKRDNLSCYNNVFAVYAEVLFQNLTKQPTYTAF